MIVTTIVQQRKLDNVDVRVIDDDVVVVVFRVDDDDIDIITSRCVYLDCYNNEDDNDSSRHISLFRERAIINKTKQIDDVIFETFFSHYLSDQH